MIRQPPAPRTGFRQYSDEAVERVRFIRHAKDLAFTLSEIGDFVKCFGGEGWWDGDRRSVARRAVEVNAVYHINNRLERSVARVSESRMTQKDKAERLRALHSADELLVLPNIWDPIGARILEAKGYPAAATASAAVAASLGYDDGERIRRSTLIDVISRIVRSVDIPVTADIEAGFASSTQRTRRDHRTRSLDWGCWDQH